MSMSAKAAELIELPPTGSQRTHVPGEDNGLHGAGARAGFAALGFAGLCALGECGGSLSHEAYRLIGLSLLGVLWLFHLRRPSGSAGWLWLGGGVALAALALWWATMGPAAALLGAVLVAVSLGMLVRASGRQNAGSPVAVPLALAALTMAAYFLLTRRITPLWQAANGVAETLSCWLGTLTNQPIRLRATYFGVPVLLGAGVWVAAWLGGGQARQRRTEGPSRALLIGLLVLAVLAVGAVYVLGSARILHSDALIGDGPFNTQQSTAKAAVEAWGNKMGDVALREKRDHELAKLGWMTFLHRTVPWNLPVLLIAAQVLLITVLAACAANKPPPLGAWVVRPQPVVLIGSGAAVVLLMLAILPLAPGLRDNGLQLTAKTSATEATHKVVFYDRGLLNWGRPHHGDYGSRSTGMFGQLMDLLEAQSIAWDRVGRIESDTLADADTMVFINFDEPLTDPERKRVWDFVTAGGRLLVLADHTMQHHPVGTAKKLLRRYQQLASPASASAMMQRTATDLMLDMGPRAADQIRAYAQRAPLTAAEKLTLTSALPRFDLRYGPPGDWVPPMARCRRDFMQRQILTLISPAAEIRATRRHTLAQLRLLGPAALSTIREFVSSVPPGEAQSRLRELADELAQVPEKPVYRRNFTNELLGEEAGIQFNFDSADFAVGGWLHGLEYAEHPTTAGMLDRRTEPGHVVGATLSTRWPARPLLIGKHGYADIGDYGAENRAHLGTYEYEANEPLGDLPLAAWGPFGAGQVYVFADTSGFANPITTSSHAFITRVFGAVTYKRVTTNDGWVIVAIGLGILAAVALATWGRRPLVLGLCAVLLLIFGGGWSPSQEARFRYPRGRHVAYLDASHMPRGSGEGWRPDGQMGAHLNLARSGYYTMNLTQWNPDRLADAGLLLSVAPTRAYSDDEIEQIYRFVENGGRFILTVGGEHVQPVRGLLKRFGVTVSEEAAMGYFKLPALDQGSSGPTVMFWEAWPVRPTADADYYALIEWIEQRRLGPNGDYTLSADGFRLHYSPLAPGALAAAQSAAAKQWRDDRGYLHLTQPDGHGRAVTRAYLPPTMTLPEPATDFEVIAHYHTPPAGDDATAEYDAERLGKDAIRRNRYDMLILSRRIGKKGGRIVVVGDSHWATNKNLEEEEQPRQGPVRHMENIQFWRWLLRKLDSKTHLNRLAVADAAHPASHQHTPAPTPQPSTAPATQPAAPTTREASQP